ncbi:MAG: response regulator [Myxococcales bacterium]|nr:response regulator [Myxococcales bacterium]
MQRPEIVLVVDDDPFNVKLLSQACKSAGFSVRVAEDGISALESIAEVLPAVLLLDLMIPRLDGFGVLARLRGAPETAELPVIVVSAVQEAQARLRVVELGADDFLPKPFRLIDLQKRLRAAISLRAFKRRYVLDVSAPVPSPAAVPEVPITSDEAAAVDAVLSTLRSRGIEAQALTVEFSAGGSDVVIEAVLSGASGQLGGDAPNSFARGPRRYTFITPRTALEARHLAAALHAQGSTARANPKGAIGPGERPPALPRIWWGVGPDRVSADLACENARHMDLEPLP